MRVVCDSHSVHIYYEYRKKIITQQKGEVMMILSSPALF